MIAMWVYSNAKHSYTGSYRQNQGADNLKDPPVRPPVRQFCAMREEASWIVTLVRGAGTNVAEPSTPSTNHNGSIPHK